MQNVDPLAEFVPDIVEVGGQRCVVARVARRDQLFVLSKNGTLNSVEFSAGRELQRLRERASIGPLRAMGFDAVYQDKDQRRAPRDRAWDALGHFRRILKIKERMTPRNWRIVCLVCFSQATHGDLVRVLGFSSRRRIGPHVQRAFEELANIIPAV